jgi:ubiquinone/menaquinone biosynthesis C-methylase UbiE
VGSKQVYPACLGAANVLAAATVKRNYVRMAAIYDAIGRTYRRTRQPDPRIGEAIAAAVRDCASLLNVGAGTGSYEVKKEQLVALEPSLTMIKQRPPEAAPVVCGRAEALPFADKSFDAVSCILTVHHWSDRPQGMAECSRVARKRVVFFTIDPEALNSFWLFDYFPEIINVDRKVLPSFDSFAGAFASMTVQNVMIPEDCRDGFLGAFWKRPHAFLDESVRAGISTFARLKPEELESGLHCLRNDLESGAWQVRYPELTALHELDLGYRIVSCEPRSAIC